MATDTRSNSIAVTTEGAGSPRPTDAVRRAGLRYWAWSTRNRLKYACVERYRSGDYYTVNAFFFYRCVFVHIPKTAGISVAQSLFGNLAGAHRRLADYEALLSPADYRSFFKFAFVRNPLARLYSAYTFLARGGMNGTDRQWAEHHLAGVRDFEDFVLNWLPRQETLEKPHLRPQHEYVLVNGAIGTDFLGRFETLERDFRTVAQRLGLESRLGRMNVTAGRASDGRRLQERYTPRMKDIVLSRYRLDFELFGYDV